MTHSMGADRFVEKITGMVEPILRGMGLELVELQFRRESIGQVLRLIIDCENGLTIDDCTKVSKEVGYLLEVENVIDQAFHLEVSSPGLDRPLQTERDFNRCTGKKISVSARVDDSLTELTGILNGCENGVLELYVDQATHNIPIQNIEKAVQVIEF